MVGRSIRPDCSANWSMREERCLICVAVTMALDPRDLPTTKSRQIALDGLPRALDEFARVAKSTTCRSREASFTLDLAKEAACPLAQSSQRESGSDCGESRTFWSLSSTIQQSLRHSRFVKQLAIRARWDGASVSVMGLQDRLQFHRYVVPHFPV